MNGNLVESDLRSIRADIVRLAEVQKLQNESVDMAVNDVLFVCNRMDDHWKLIEGHDVLLYELRKQLRHWQTLVLVMAGWMLVATVLLAFRVI